MGEHSSRLVTFQHNFVLPGMAQPHAKGTFEVLVYEEQLDVMWAASRSTLSIVLPYPGYVEAMPVTAHDLSEAMRKDQQSCIRSGYS